MATKLISKSELENEPDYTGSQNDCEAGTQACPTNEDEPVQKIVAVTLKNKKGEAIQQIDQDDEVELVIQTQEMAGEELVLDLAAMGGSFLFEGQKVSGDHVLVINVESDEEKVALKVQPERLTGFD